MPLDLGPEPIDLVAGSMGYVLHWFLAIIRYQRFAATAR